MKIFLAGSSQPPTQGEWRYQATAGNITRHKGKLAEEDCWNVRKCIYGAHELTGPYYDETSYQAVNAKHCTALIVTAIAQSDLVFAWLEDAPDIFWMLGLAQMSETRTAIGTYGEVPEYMRLIKQAVDIQITQATSPADALAKAVRTAEVGSDFRGSWRKFVSKYDSDQCPRCARGIYKGDIVMWRRGAETNKSSRMHLDCFMYGAPLEAIPRDLQGAGIEILQKKVLELSEEKERLVETVRDLGRSS